MYENETLLVLHEDDLARELDGDLPVAYRRHKAARHPFVDISWFTLPAAMAVRDALFAKKRVYFLANRIGRCTLLDNGIEMKPVEFGDVRVTF